MQDGLPAMQLGFVVLVYIRCFKERCAADAAIARRRESVSPIVNYGCRDQKYHKVLVFFEP